MGLALSGGGIPPGTANRAAAGTMRVIGWFLASVGALFLVVWTLVERGHRLTVEAAPGGGLQGRLEDIGVLGTEVTELPAGSLLRVTHRVKEVREGKPKRTKHYDYLVVVRSAGEDLEFRHREAAEFVAKVDGLVRGGGPPITAETPLAFVGLVMGLFFVALGGGVLLYSRRERAGSS